MKTLLLCIALTLPAAAQRKLWTWTPPNQAPDVSHTILAYTSTSSGVCLVVYIETDFDGGAIESRTYQAALISAKGETLKTTTIAAPAFYDQALNFNPYHQNRWKAIGADKTAGALTDGEQIVRFTIKGKASAIVVEEVLPVTERGVFAMPDGRLGSSYLKLQKSFAGFESAALPGDGNFGVDAYRLTSVELWSLK